MQIPRIAGYIRHIAAGRRFYRHRNVRLDGEGRRLCTISADLLLRGEGKPGVIRQILAHQANERRTACAVVDCFRRNRACAEFLPVAFKVSSCAPRGNEQKRLLAALRANIA